jgi:GTP-binding protein
MGDHAAHGSESLLSDAAKLPPKPILDLFAGVSEGERADMIERGRKLFAGTCDFTAGATRAEILPAPTLPEVAFAGRSNVGKSSLINALTGRTTLARVSHTPGRTQQLNFFDLGGKLMLVDLPGYGYAKVAKRTAQEWSALIHEYLKGRVNLRRLCLLIDSRHGLKPGDEEIMKLLDLSAVPYRVVLTKIDKVKPAELASVIEATRQRLVKHPAAAPLPWPVSAHDAIGIAELRAELAAVPAV